MTRYDAATLRTTLNALFQEAGAHEEVAETTARILVEGDLLGHHTHGVTPRDASGVNTDAANG